MKKLYLLLLTGLFIYACGNAGSNNNDNPVVNGHAFYGQPFDKVPEPSDVVMYEANERVFAATGSLNAIKGRLDAIKDLGINVLWLMPVTEQGKLKAIGSPYCVKDYKKVEPEYGSLDDLRQLVEQAHNRGIAVIIDWVANHTSWDNEWINHPDWYTHDAAGNIIPPEGTGWNDVADLNYDNPAMRAAMIDAMKYWIYEANIDGFRFDAADFVPADFWKQTVDELRKFNDRTLLLLAEGARDDHYAVGFDMDYGWDFYDKIKKLYKGEASLAAVYTSHENEYKHIPDGKQKLRFITNHDESGNDATPIALFGGQPGALSAFALTLAVGGAPLVYSTQEIGVPTVVPFFTPTAINWNLNPETLAEYKRLLAAYNASNALKRGRLQTFAGADVACIHRLYQAENALVLVNVRSHAVSYAVPAQFVSQTFVNALDGATVVLPATVDLSPYEYLILKK